MSFIPPLTIGEVITNGRLSDVFKVGNMGGMRRSNVTGTLVLISDNTKGLYHDQWHDGKLLYTGMGKIGDQVLAGNQNKTLAESDSNGVKVYLFEVNIPGQYTFSGRVKLAAAPYQENQPDDNGQDRKVWVFPLEKIPDGDDSLPYYVGVYDSWEILDERTAIKHCDFSFFNYRESGIPLGVCGFFGAETLEPGETRSLTLIYEGKEYRSVVRNYSTDRRRCQINWYKDLGDRFAKFHYEEGCVAVFKKLGNTIFEVSMKGDEAKVVDDKSTKEIIEQVKTYIAARGFSYDAGLIENFYLSLRSKPFVILAGTSGTGKTRLVRLFAEAIGAAYEQVAVRPDWSDSTDLFGHVDLNGRFVPGKILEFLSEAQQNPEISFMLCLDEMNLARVEYYLSDFLSVIETREWMNGKIVADPLVSEKEFGVDDGAREKFGEIRFPENLYIVGTVNMDETTFPFSRKVLDRANTIEFDYVDLVPVWPDDAGEVGAVMQENGFLRSRYLKLADCAAEDREYVSAVCAELEKVNKVLARANAHVGYRVRDEIVFYLLNNREAGLLAENAAMDNEILQKILPRIQGSSASVKSMLCDLFKEIAGDYEGYQTESNNTADRMMDLLWKNGSVHYPKSARKIAFMVRRFEEDGFTSYWL